MYSRDFKDSDCVRATADIDQCYFEAKALRLSWALAERVVILALYKSDVLPRWGVAWSFRRWAFGLRPFGVLWELEL